MPTLVVSPCLTDAFDEGLTAIVPRHCVFSNHLLNEKSVESYASSSDRSRSWVVMMNSNAATVQAHVEQFPLYCFLGGVEIDKLFIFDSTTSCFPLINLH